MIQTPRLSVFLALSLLAHGALAIAWRGTVPLSQSGTSLQVSLLAPQPRPIRQTEAGTEGAPRQTPHKRPAHKKIDHTHRLLSTMPATPVSADAATAVARTANGGARPMPVQVAARAEGHELKKRLMVSLAHYFYYPPVAIRYAWQGTVRIGLRVNDNGQISHIHLIHSSGYAVLDAAALRSTHRIKTIGALDASSAHGAFDLQVPVVYRLAQS